MQHISTLVAPACSALALAAGADTLWRSLNYALLMYDVLSRLTAAKILTLSHAHARCGAAGAFWRARLCGRVGQQLARGGMLPFSYSLDLMVMCPAFDACFCSQYLVLAAETAPFLYEVEEDDDEVKC
jgi:hypothetical protein